MIIGIIGGVGSGKSTVLDYLEEKYHADIIKADDVAKEVMEPGHLVYDNVCKAFPDAISENGIDSKILAEIVFSDEEKLKLLNSITHPGTIDEICKRIDSSNNKIIVVESAILIGSGVEDKCDEIWFVYCNHDKRIERLMKDRGYSKEKSESIIANQLSDEECNKVADEFIDNSNSKNETYERIDLVLSNLSCDL